MQAAGVAEGGAADVLHVHGAWSGCSQIANVIRRKYGTPVVVAPHGTLQPWALRKAAWKKRLAALVYERENLREAACLHALAQMEVADCRDYGLRNPIALIPNGVSRGWLDSTGDGGRFREQFGISADRRILLFLSRITPKKGLPLLLEALDQQRHRLGDWLLVVAGADEFDHLREVQEITTRRNLTRHVLFPGPLYNQTKRDAFAAAEAFVLPSRSEGAPIAVLEGLGAGLPVLATKGSPWEDLVPWEAGWWTDVSADAISDALADLLTRSPADLQRMGQNGLALIHDRYLWQHQARKTLDLYRWLTGSADKPDFVITD
jgi:glycosyltransferase involved in cell wall biosynthesis